MADKKINNIIIIVFIIVSVLLVFIDFALQFASDKEFYKKKSELISVPAESSDSTSHIEEEIQLPVDFRE